ncbi:polysaccharide deacetylase family protein [Arenibacter sp. F26102]|uniref:polysaccharide deacetylase family protein n=1 Tax=Arenibacter sp. F26102 TaxID=2926416 RepID=UPI001FF39CDE|nr:polysaccharide deacetylase family protein [Arenibacter sp. F26102]MCK0144821.1 polysaccharide deacetylase family protein [Arenibacter sp. F26102]
MKKSYPISLFMSLCMALLLINCGEKKKNADAAINSETTEQKTLAVANTWAEKLGWPAGKKVIMLHADDIGMCPEANIAAKEQLSKGQIQSAAVMIPCPNAEEFINWAKENPAMDIGLHLTLTSEWKKHRWGPITPDAEVPGLLDPEDKLWRSVPEVVQHATAEEVEKEIRAQIEQSIAWGYRPDHIDTHMGTLFGHPSYVKAYIKVAQEYGIPANIIDISVPSVLAEFRAKGYPMDDSVVKMSAEYTLPKLDYFTSAPKAATYEEKLESFKELIKSLKPGLTEIIFHPSVDTDNLRSITGSWQQRVWETEIFADPELINFFKEEGIIFTNWKEIMSRFNSMN